MGYFGRGYCRFSVNECLLIGMFDDMIEGGREGNFLQRSAGRHCMLNRGPVLDEVTNEWVSSTIVLS